MKSKGILSIYWGDESRLPIERLTKSVKQYCPHLPHKVVRVDAPSDDSKSLNQKAAMLDFSPFDLTLYLDIDTVVMGDLTFGFDCAEKHGIALSICESPWARRYTKLFQYDQIEYNTGVIFFSKESKSVFNSWKEYSKTKDSSLIGIDNSQIYTMPSNDQGTFALSIESNKFNPFVLPLNWNFRPMWHTSFCGPIRIWHDYADPPQVIFELNKYYENKDSVIQYHQFLK